jgi:hypothetical protein
LKLLNLRKDKAGAIYYIQIGIVILILSALAVPILGSVFSAVNPGQLDINYRSSIGSTNYNVTPAQNATRVVISTSGTVLGLNPLAALIAVAAGMISLLIGAFVVARPGGGI